MNYLLELIAQTDPMSLTTALLSGLGVLSGAVGYLYKSQHTLQKEVTQKISQELDECRSDRRDLWAALIKINPEAEALRNIK